MPARRSARVSLVAVVVAITGALLVDVPAGPVRPVASAPAVSTAARAVPSGHSAGPADLPASSSQDRSARWYQAVAAIGAATVWAVAIGVAVLFLRRPTES